MNPFPTSLDAMTGEKETISWGVFPLMGEDALYVRSDGGGGFGDPLAREPRRVQADIEAGTVSDGVAASVYGVVMTDGAVDEAATRARREALRRARLAAPTAAAGPPSARPRAAPNGAQPSERSERPALEGT